MDLVQVVPIIAVPMTTTTASTTTTDNNNINSPILQVITIVAHQPAQQPQPPSCYGSMVHKEVAITEVMQRVSEW